MNPKIYSCRYCFDKARLFGSSFTPEFVLCLCTSNILCRAPRRVKVPISVLQKRRNFLRPKWIGERFQNDFVYFYSFIYKQPYFSGCDCLMSGSVFEIVG